MSGKREIHVDSDPLFTGTHKGGDGAEALYDPGACFKSLGVHPDLTLYVENETQGTDGYALSATEDSVSVDESKTGSGAVTWDRDDVYSIYKTDSKNSFISSMWVDRRRGVKLHHGDKINRDGILEEDVDIDDKGRKKVFGPGQPED